MAGISRRWFIGGAASFGALGGCRFFSGSGFASGTPRLRFGVVSDIHLKRRSAPGESEESANNELTFVRTLEWFRDQGVDGVVVAGDMADQGTIEQLELVAEAWNRVFPGDRAPDGRKVERLFVYGNHDMGGVPYARGMSKGMSLASRITLFWQLFLLAFLALWVLRGYVPLRLRQLAVVVAVFVAGGFAALMRDRLFAWLDSSVDEGETSLAASVESFSERRLRRPQMPLAS